MESVFALFNVGTVFVLALFNVGIKFKHGNDRVEVNSNKTDHFMKGSISIPNMQCNSNKYIRCLYQIE